jgi:hypothetical protein
MTESLPSCFCEKFQENPMRKINILFIFGNTILLTWAILCVGIFINLPIQNSYIQWANFNNFAFLPEKLERIEPARYFLALIFSFAGIAGFTLASKNMQT